MSRLSDYRLLSFDVYGTLIDWETGVVNGLKPLVEANNASFTREQLLEVYHEIELQQQLKTPGMKYSELLTTIHPQIAERLGFSTPTAEQNKAFGSSIGSWPAFPDTVEALKRLSKHYKLVVLSNVDVNSFSMSNKGPLEGFPFDLILTAQDIGSYKPSLKNFEYMLHEVETKFGVKKPEVLQTAHSQFHDHHPAKKMGIKSSWIVRPGSLVGNMDDVFYDWRFDTLKDMADGVEKELDGQQVSSS